MPSRSDAAIRPTVRPVRLRGFTLMELMVTVAVLAILASLAAPSFTAVINNNRLATQANDLVASLQLARMEAVRRNESVAVCRSADGATCAGTAGAWTGWLTVLTRNNEILRAGTARAPVQISSAAHTITFRADGLARNGAGGLLNTSLTACVETTHPAENQRVVSVASGSRISTDSSDGGGDCP